ncbi:MAG: type II secretion system F family protein [Pseudomonadota bacterium]
MPQFSYHAVDKAGRTSDGTMAAESEHALERRLREVGFWLIEARPLTAKKRTAKNFKVPRRELVEFFTGSTSLLLSGIPIAETITAMAQETTHLHLKVVLENISLSVQAGTEVSESFRAYPGVFSDQVCNLIRAGEQGGNLATTFEDLAHHLEWVEGIVADVRQASIYPVSIIAAVAGLIGLMFTVVVPKFAEIFVDLGIELPALTRAVLTFGEVAQTYWWAFLLSIAGVVMGIKFLTRTQPKVALLLDQLRLNMPVFGDLYSMLLQSQFVHTLALMLKSGVPILDALTLSRGVSKSPVLDAAIKDAVASVEEGHKISEALRAHPVIASLTLRMIIVGEDAGRLDITLQQVADRFDKEIPRKLKKVFATLEPMITLTLVVIVGLVAASLFMPMFTLMSGLR